jgi:hypothetical protein
MKEVVKAFTGSFLELATPHTFVDWVYALAFVVVFALCVLGLVFFYFMPVKHTSIIATSELEDWQQSPKSVEMLARESEGTDAMV